MALQTKFGAGLTKLESASQIEEDTELDLIDNAAFRILAGLVGGVIRPILAAWCRRPLFHADLLLPVVVARLAVGGTVRTPSRGVEILRQIADLLNASTRFDVVVILNAVKATKALRLA